MSNEAMELALLLKKQYSETGKKEFDSDFYIGSYDIKVISELENNGVIKTNGDIIGSFTLTDALINNSL